MGMGGRRDGPASLHSGGEKLGVMAAVCTGAETISTGFFPWNVQLVASRYILTELTRPTKKAGT